MKRIIVAIAIIVSASACVRTRTVYQDRYIVVPDTTYRASFAMFTELFEAYERQYNVSIDVDSTAIDFTDVCTFARRWAAEADLFMRIKLQRR